MDEIQSIIQSAHELVAKTEYDAARKILEAALADHPGDKDLHAELGIIYCFGQKEFDAAEHLEPSVGSERHIILSKLLRDYFYCRKKLSRKLNITDQKGDETLQRIGKHFEGEPLNVGVLISACLIVKNEEKHLERCLKSIQPIVDQIVVVDTGSTDRTIEIAKQFEARIGHFDWCDDFSAARNVSLALATGHWILWIDADEELDPGSFGQIREAIIRPQFAGYYFQIINYMDAKVEANTYVHTAVRLFRNIPDVRFSGRIHEQIIGTFKERGYVPATLTKGILKHYGYQQETMVEKDKVNRTIGILTREVEEFPEEPFHWFNLANVYSVAMSPREAEPAAIRCAEFIQEDAPYGPANFQILSSSQTALGRPADALRSCEWAVKKGYDSILNQFEKAHALKELGRFEEGLETIDHCMEMEWPISLTGDYGIKTYKSHVLKAQILTRLKRYDEAGTCVKFALAKHPEFPMALFAKAEICEKTNRPEEAFALYVRCSSAPGMGPSKKLAGRVAIEMGLYVDAMLVFQQAWHENQNDFEAWLGWAGACMELEDWDGYLNACELVGEDRLPGSDLLVNWGRALAAKGDYDAALKKFGAAITKNPENANAYFNCGDTLYKLGYFQEAARVYKHGLDREPHNAEGWFVLGNCFAKMSVLSGAKTSYNQALTLAPDHLGAKQNLQAIQKAA